MTDPSLFDEEPEPIRPYWQDNQPSSGWSGSDTSKAAEPYRLTEQNKVWLALRDAGAAGLTWAEATDVRNAGKPKDEHIHHGTVSGALSNLHKAGHAARLTEKRRGRKVYVLPSFIGDRDTEAPTKRVDPVAAERERILQGLAWLIAPDYTEIPAEQPAEVREAMSNAAHVVLGHRWDDNYQVWHDGDCPGNAGDGCVWQRWAPSR